MRSHDISFKSLQDCLIWKMSILIFSQFSQSLNFFKPDNWFSIMKLLKVCSILRLFFFGNLRLKQHCCFEHCRPVVAFALLKNKSDNEILKKHPN